MDKKKIIVLSAEDFLKTIYFDNLKIEKPYIVISIRDDDRILPIEIKKTDLCKDVLVSEFIDLPESRVLELKEELNNGANNSNSKADNLVEKGLYFNNNKAKEIFEYLSKHKANDDFEKILIHCVAGQSRSQAIGLFAEIYFNEDYSNIGKRLHEGNLDYFLKLQEYLPKEKQISNEDLLEIIDRNKTDYSSEDLFI